MMSNDRLASNTSGDESFKLPDHLLDGIRQMHERWNNRLELESLNIAKEYINGRIGILIEMDVLTNWENTNNDFTSVHVVGTKITIPHNHVADVHRWNGCNPESRREGLVFFLVVKNLEPVNQIACPAFKKFESEVEITQHFGGCFYSPTRGYVMNPVLTDRQRRMFILCASVSPAQFPVRVFQSGTQIVDSIANNESQNGRQCFLIKVDSDGLSPGFTININNQFWGVSLLKDSESMYKIRDVMLGPFNL